MNEKIKEIIENEMDCLITDVDFVIKKEGSLQALINMLEEAINYRQCSTELPTKEIIDYLEISEDFYIDDYEMANRFYNAALKDTKYFIKKRLEERNKAIT